MAKPKLLGERASRRVRQMLNEHKSDEDRVVLAPEQMGPPPAAFSQPRWGKLYEDLDVDSTADVTFWQATGGGWHGWDEASDVVQECYASPFQDVTIDTDEWVLVARVNGRWVCLPINSGGGTARWGKLDGSLAADGTATVSLWQTTGGGWEGWDEDSTDNVVAYAWPGQVSAVASGAWVRIVKQTGRWIVDMAVCP